MSTGQKGDGLRLWTAALAGGVAAGTLDLVWAVVSYRVDLPTILRVIAGGWLGRDARTGGSAAAALGAVSHYAILIVAAGLYAFTARRTPVLVRRPGLCGLAYGAAVYAVMNYAVVPLSQAPPRPHPPLADQLPHLLAHMILVGLPIAFAARLATRTPRSVAEAAA